jgi:hypothetical protein
MDMTELALRQQLRDSMDDEIAKRTKKHQAQIASIRTAAANRLAAGAAPPNTPLVMLAHGDSWFDYPLSGNSISLTSTDIIVQLGSMGNVNPFILNMSQWGDATTAEMSLPKQQLMISALQDPSNWLNSTKPDAILFSGGGNDIAGDQFCIYLDYAAVSATGLDVTRLQDALGMVEASYLDLFAFRDRNAHGVPIFSHSYDFPVPNGVHPVCAGPWLKPSLDFCGYDPTQGAAIVRQALTEFKKQLTALASDPGNNFTLVDTQGVLDPADWANELHPYPQGFQKLAGKFVDALRSKFPGRI